VIVIAHNANFDRKFAERYWPFFEQKRGLVRQLRWNGENTDLMDRGWGIC